MPIYQPNENDVLLGRGGRNYEHEGNEQLRRIARSRMREYQQARKKQKSGAVQAIFVARAVSVP